MKKHVYKFEELLSILNENEPEQIYSALTHLINNKTEIISDKFGKKGHVMNVKNLYVFQPQEFNDSYTSFYDKVRPLKHRPLKIDVTKQAPKLIENKSILIDKSLGINTSIMNNSLLVSSNRLLESMKTKFEIGMKTKGSLKDKNKNFYENYSLVINELNELLPNISISNRKKKEWLIEHLVETLPFKKELSLVNYLFQNNFDPVKDKFVFLVKKYYENNIIFNFLEGKLLFLIDLADKNTKSSDKSHLFDSNMKLYYKPEHEENFRKLTQSEKQDGQDEIIKILKKVKVDHNKVSKYLVFIGHYEKDKENPNQLKIKKLGESYKSKNNKGRVFKNELPKNMYPVLNDIIGSKSIPTKIFIKEQLTVILEIISKLFTNKENIIYINKLQYAENNVEEL